MTAAHPTNWLEVAALIVLVLASAFFSASETALVSVGRVRARTLHDRKLRGSADVVALVDNKSHVLTSILTGNTIALLAADSLATTIAIDMGLAQAALWSTFVMAVVLLLFGEIIPKTLAAGSGDRWLLVLSPTLRIVAIVIGPISNAFTFVANGILRIFGIRVSHQIYVTEEDIRSLVDVGAEQRVIEEEEREMIHSVIEFGDTIVREVMTPRPEIVAVSDR